MSLILPGNVASALPSGYNVDNSCRFNQADSAYMHITPSGDGNKDTFTISMWVKRCKLGDSQFLFGTGSSTWNDTFFCRFRGTDELAFGDFETPSYTWLHQTDRKFRDVSAWYHFVFKIDTTQATESDRVKLFVNGVQETSFSVRTYPSQNTDQKWNKSSTLQGIGRVGAYDDDYASLYMAEVVSIDGTALNADSFGEFDEDSPTIWKPKDVSGLTFGTNGFYLDFKDSSNLGNNAGSGSADLTEVNIDATDQATDTPTNNFCTLNPLEAVTATTTYAQGNMQGTTSNAARATFAVTNGKWYWEHKAVNKEAMGGVMAYDGFLPNAYTINALISCHGPNLVLNGSEESGWADGTPDALVDNDILQVALDCDNNRIAFGVNGAWYNATDGSGEWSGTTLNYFSISDGYYYSPAFRTGSGTNRVSHMNFGGCPGFAISSGNADGNGYGNFEYAVPSGFYALCTKNLAEYG